MQLSFAALSLVLAAMAASAQTTLTKPAPGFVQAAAGPSYTKDEPRFAPSSIPNAQPTDSNTNNAAVTPSSAAHHVSLPVAGAGIGLAGALAAFLL